MIDSVTLHNFESHKNTKVPFGPSLNVIVGDSDKGKSGLLRGLLWAVDDKLSINGHISKWALNDKGNQKDETYVIVQKDGNEIHRIRNKKDNLYHLYGEGYPDKGLKLAAIGNGFPEEVEKFWNFTAVNIQKQMDSPFLLSETAGKVAQTFNRIIKLEAIDKALSDVDSKKRQQKSKLKNWTEQSEKLQTDIQKYDELPVLEEKVNAYEKMGLAYTDLTLDSERISELITWINGEQLHLNRLPKIIELEESCILYMTKNTDTVQLVNRNTSLTALIEETLNNTYQPSVSRSITRLSSSLENYTVSTTQIEVIKSNYNSLYNIRAELLRYQELLNEKEDVDFFGKKLEKYSVEIQKINTLDSNMETIGRAIGNHKMFSNQVERFPDEIKQLQNSLPEICPICGSKM